MLAMLAKQKLIGHTGDVIADDDMPCFRASRFFMRKRHGSGRIEIIQKKLFETADGTVAIFRDSRDIVNVFEEKAFQLRVAFGKGCAETC